jgi:hypothetical protein
MLTRLTAQVFRCTVLIAFNLAALGTTRTIAQEHDGAGAVIIAQASAKDVGLPIYPNSKPYKDKDNDSAGANLGLWGGGAGLKLAVLKMESSDTPERIAAFYKKALSKYGPVLDCSNPPFAGANTDKNDSSKTLTCEDAKAEKGGYVFKAGTKEKHHLVAIQPNGAGTLYQLLNIGSWGAK